MGRLRKNGGNIAIARRGRIIQRILVDGWTAAQAAASFDVTERQVVRWLAAYRRDGMASLRDGIAAERGPRRWARRLKANLARLFNRLRGGSKRAEPAPCVALRRRRDDGRRR